MSVLRPGTFRVSSALTRNSRMPRCSSMSYTGIRRVGGGAPSCPSAGHRPPLKRGVRFSRATLSRRRPLLGCNRRNQFDQLYQPILAVKFALRQLLPAAVAPAFVPMRPNAPLDPMVEFVEERSDVSTLVVVTPPPQDWVQLLDQFLGFQRHASPGKLTYPILEALNRFLTRVGVQPTRFGPSNDLARWQLKLLSAPDQVAQKFESTLNMHHPRFLRMQLHAQLTQDPEGCCYCGPRLRRRRTGNHPIICEPCKLITLAPHLPIKRRQKYVTEQGRDHPALRSAALAWKEPPFAIASCLEHRPNQAQHSAIPYSL